MFDLQDQNMFDSKKKMKVATGDGLHQKLTAPQRQTIAINQSLLYMFMNQVKTGMFQGLKVKISHDLHYSGHFWLSVSCCKISC